MADKIGFKGTKDKDKDKDKVIEVTNADLMTKLIKIESKIAVK